MKRGLLDIIFSAGGLLLAILLLVLGLVLNNQANFAKNYVADQMGEQQISFTPLANLTAEEKAANPCITKNAGKPLTTGKQAECYANFYIGLHVKAINDGKTYAQTSNQARAAHAKADAATKSNAADAAGLEKQASTLDAKADSLFRGETLRGLLLTSYGFSIFGERAGQAATVAFLVAGVLLLAAIAGFIHAVTKGDEDVRLPRAET